MFRQVCNWCAENGVTMNRDEVSTVAARVHFGSSRRASPVAACARRPFAAAERLHALEQLLELRLLLALGEPARRLVGEKGARP